MTNQTHKDRVKDAGKKRRAYLWKKASANTLIWVGLVVFLVFGALATAGGFRRKRKNSSNIFRPANGPY